MRSHGCLFVDSGVRSQGTASAAAGAGRQARGARAGAGGAASPRLLHRRRRARGGQAGDAPLGGARHLPGARAPRAGSGRGGGGVGGCAAAARGSWFRRRARRAGLRLLRDAGNGTPGGWPEGGAAAGSRRGGAGVGSSCGGGLPALRGARGGNRRAGRSGARDRRRRDEPLPRASAAGCPAAVAGAEGRALGARRQAPGGAGTPPRSGGRRSARHGRRGGVAARPGGRRRRRRAAPSAGRARRDAFLSGAGGERAHARRGRWLRSSSACSPARSGPAGPHGSSPSRRSSSEEARGGAQLRCASRRRSPTAFGSRWRPSSRSCRRRRQSCGSSWGS